MSNKEVALRDKSFQYDVTLSFAGENRSYVRKVADTLRKLGIRVFYDEYSEVDLWGKDLYTHLQYIYKDAAKYCILFISKHYAKKVWTNHERASAQARAIKQNQEYILPVRFDDTELPGLLETVGFLDLRKTTTSKLAAMAQKKIGSPTRYNYFPPVPDLLFKQVNAVSKSDKDIVYGKAFKFFETLKRMSVHERHLLYYVLTHHCPCELPVSVHIEN